jgi:Raf kinase inhibitor-like YbhB/YbcL family protein
MKRNLLVMIAFAAFFAAAAAGAGLQITSPAFQNNGAIPTKYTCDASPVVSPPLQFSGVPSKAQSLVLIVDDPDVPKNMMPSGVFNHWVVWDLPSSSTGFKEGDGMHGINGTGKPGWIGPCPPDREHRYFFTLYALDTKLTAKMASKADVEAAMKGHVLEQAQLVGRYARAKK